MANNTNTNTVKRQAHARLQENVCQNNRIHRRIFGKNYGMSGKILVFSEKL